MKNKRNPDNIIDQYLKGEKRLKSLPQLSVAEKVALDQSVDIEHLYFSSKIEGTNLTKRQIEEAIHGKEI
jgi:hypothetical protein